MKRIKILQISTSTVGGPGQLILDLAKFLDRHRFDVSVAFGAGYPLDQIFHKEGIKTTHLSISRDIAPLANIKGFFQILRLLRREPFDIVHTHCSMASFLGRIAAKLSKCPIIILQDQGFAFTRGSQGLLKKSLYLLIERLLEPITDHYITVSKALEQIGIKHKVLKPGKVSVIYNGIDPRRFAKTMDTKMAKNEMALDTAAPVLGIVGRLELQKGVDVFLKGASIITNAKIPAQFLVVGDGPLRKKLEITAQILNITDRVFFSGWKTDMVRVLQAIDIFCLTSLWEGMPLAVLEAMAMGKPVVAAKVRGIDEVVEDGKTGILIPLNNPDAFAGACTRLLNDHELSTAMGKAGRMRFEQMFTVDSMINKYQDLYLQIYGEKISSKAPPKTFVHNSL